MTGNVYSRYASSLSFVVYSRFIPTHKLNVNVNINDYKKIISTSLAFLKSF